MKKLLRMKRKAILPVFVFVVWSVAGISPSICKAQLSAVHPQKSASKSHATEKEYGLNEFS